VTTSLKASLLPTPIPIAFQILIVPVIDNTATVSTIWSSKAHAPWLTPSRMSWYRRMYLPDSARDSEWSASPNLAPDEVLSRSPKTWVAVADQDLLSPEALAFAEQLIPSFKKLSSHRRRSPFLVTTK
jgi:acetyl esterase/lipase